MELVYQKPSPAPISVHSLIEQIKLTPAEKKQLKKSSAELDRVMKLAELSSEAGTKLRLEKAIEEAHAKPSEETTREVSQLATAHVVAKQAAEFVNKALKPAFDAAHAIATPVAVRVLTEAVSKLDAELDTFLQSLKKLSFGGTAADVGAADFIERINRTRDDLEGDIARAEKGLSWEILESFDVAYRDD